MRFSKNILKNKEPLLIKKYSDIKPEPLFFCESRENFLKRFFRRENFVFLKFGEINKQKRKKIITLVFVPVAIIAILTGGVCVSLKENENANKALLAPRSEIITSQETLEETKKLLVLNSPQNNKTGNLNVELETFDKIKCDKKIVTGLKNLINGAKKSGYSLAVSEGYIDRSVRKKAYEDEILRLENEENYTLARAEAAAVRTIAPYYEHETGLSVTITTRGLSSYEFINTDEYKWLIRNCVDYGFVIRTPQNKESKTGLCFDSTLYRYVGVENARKMRTLNMCIEEFRRYLKIKN